MRDRDVGTSFDIWCYDIPKDLRDPVWKMAIMALAWSIWRIRNRVIFRMEAFSEEACFKLWQFDLAWWARAEWREGSYPGSFGHNSEPRLCGNTKETKEDLTTLRLGSAGSQAD